jgi:Uma2 family endonuclease
MRAGAAAGEKRTYTRIALRHGVLAKTSYSHGSPAGNSCIFATARHRFRRDSAWHPHGKPGGKMRRQDHPMASRERLVTVEEFARIPDDDHRYELVEGRVVRMSPPGSRHAVLAARLTSMLDRHVEEHGLGVVMTSGGFHLASRPDTVREPDVAFVRAERIPESGVPDGFWPGPADLAVEIRSPGDRLSDIAAKVDEYLGRGVRLVWVVDPNARTVTVHQPNQPPVILEQNATLDGGAVIPGFSCALEKIFK